jgi:hypothetical protein
MTIKQKNGEKVYLVNSRKVLDKAREHFGCRTLDGIPLENQGGSGSAGFHWESRYMLGDYMISTDYQDTVISDITLALFEDSGFYQIDYNYGGLFKFGKNKGCNFFKKKCIENGKVLFEEEFCMNTGIPMCSHSKTFKAECLVYDYSNYNIPLPDEYQYFSNPYYGGYDTTDFCPVADFYYNNIINDGYFQTSCSVGNSNLPEEFGEKIGSKSFCFISSLIPSSSKYAIVSKAICYKIECDKNSKKIIVHIGGSKVECPSEGGTLNPKGFKGTLNCPKYSDICNFKDNRICNEVFKCLNKEDESDESSIKESESLKKIKINYFLILLYLIFYLQVFR